jgi:hypothetical protein
MKWLTCSYASILPPNTMPLTDPIARWHAFCRSSVWFLTFSLAIAEATGRRPGSCEELRRELRDWELKRDRAEALRWANRRVT